MSRYSDGSYDYRPCDDRTIDGVDIEVHAAHDAGIPFVRDVELGNRVSELWMDTLEDERDIRFWADLAQCEAMNRAMTNRGENR